jgi:BirA family biotin operon repressor/biotin-[acetyl-CoA-carboxylase] ligase
MTYDIERLRAAVAPRTLQYFPEAGSTNAIALDWLRESAPTAAVVVADAQVQGRGRLGRSWHAPAGSSLIVSVILRPPISVIGRLTMVGAVAIAEMIESLGLDAVDIKWPNDVRLNGLKVCGILPEAAWDGDRLLGVVLGMGINISTDFAGTRMETTATSLKAALGVAPDRTDLLAQLLTRVDVWCERAGSDVLFDAWQRRLSTIGQFVSVSNSDVRGMAEGVDERGALLVRTEAGTLERVVAGDIRLGE